MSLLTEARDLAATASSPGETIVVAAAEADGEAAVWERSPTASLRGGSWSLYRCRCSGDQLRDGVVEFRVFEDVEEPAASVL